MATKHKYEQVSEDKVPEGVRFDVSRPNQGQIVEVAYGAIGLKGEADVGDPWKRVTDRSEPPSSPDRVRYYRLVRS